MTVKGDRFTVSELAGELSITTRQVQNLINLGVIPETRTGTGRGGSRRYFTLGQVQVIKRALELYQVSDLIWVNRRYDLDQVSDYINDHWTKG